MTPRILSEEQYAAFPSMFKWGTATASYQIEGAVSEDGRGSSIWDTFSHTPGKTLGGDTGDVACDHYHRFGDDIQLMAELGVGSYRFSVAWPRIFPEGEGAVEPRGLEFYDRLVDRLLAHGIEPMVTLYHWDLPSALQARGGWLNRDTAYYFREYAETLFHHFADRVGHWITHNEPWCTAYLGHGTGRHAPGLQDLGMARVAAHHTLLSHGLAVRAFRDAGYPGQIGVTLNLASTYPASQTPEAFQAVRMQDVFQNRWFLDPVLAGHYPAELQTLLGPGPDPVVAGDLALIASPIDFLGVNYYSSSVVRWNPEGKPVPVTHVTQRDWVTDMGWPVMPHGLTDLLVRLHQDYGRGRGAQGLPLYVTENGAASADEVVEGKVADPDRIRYLKAHLEAIAKALDAGVDVRGYYLWSLMDNFEWGEGYHKRFGTVYVDYPTQARIPKASFYWYQELIQEWGMAHAGEI